MAKVKEINLHVVPMYGQVQFFGEGDEYPEWGDEGVAVSSAAATFLGMPDAETCSVSLHIYDEYEEVADVFYESMIAIGRNEWAGSRLCRGIERAWLRWDNGNMVFTAVARGRCIKVRST